MTREPTRTDAGAGTPRRVASQRLVEEGKGYLIAGQTGRARERLQAALRIDGSNGAAYFYLAQVAADERDWDDAEGYLARAETLLRHRDEFREPLAELARRVEDQR